METIPAPADALGNGISVGEIIGYGKRSGNSGDLDIYLVYEIVPKENYRAKYDQVTRTWLTNPDGSQQKELYYTYKLKVISHGYDYRAVKTDKMSKSTLESPSRAVRVHPDYYNEQSLKLIEFYEAHLKKRIAEDGE